MPLIFTGAGPGSREPAWVSDPDPNWFPNGICDVVFAMVRAIYTFGSTFLVITSRYVDGFPQSFTVIDESVVGVNVTLQNGRRVYRIGDTTLSELDVVQIDRNPSGQLRGSSAFGPYLPYLLSLQAGANAAQSLYDNPTPNAVLKSQRKLTGPQATALQDQWVERAGLRRGAPAVLPPEIDFEQLAFSPKDLLLLDAQQFSARVLASAVGVPPFLLNLPLEGGLTYQNPEKLGEFWFRFELNPLAVRIASALTSQMLPRGNEVSFDASKTFGDLPGVSDEALGGTQTAPASPADQQLPSRPAIGVVQG